MKNKTVFFEKVKIRAGEIFTLARIKRVGIGVLSCTVIAGAGSVYWHQQEINEHTKIVQARTRMIEVQAAKNNITLLDSEKIKEIAAEAIGIDGSSIEYTQIELTAKNNDQHSEKDAKKHKKDYEELVKTEPVASTATKVDNLATSYPVYKVTCKANSIKYRLSVDAVTGQVLNSKVIGD